MVALPQQKIGSGIGASEIAAVMGLHPWKSPIDVWLEKTGQVEPFEGNDFTEWGLWIEASIRSWYVEQRQAEVYVPSESLHHPEIEWMRATPDGIVVRRGKWEITLDCKNANWRLSDRFGPPGTDEIPEMYYAQMQQQMCVTGTEVGHLVASVGGMPPDVWVVERDEGFIAAIIEDGTEFWRLVQEHIPPTTDHTEAYKRYLDGKQALDTEVAADEYADDLIYEVMDCRNALKAIKERHDLAENKLREWMGEATILHSSEGKVTWRPGERSRPLKYPKGFPAKVTK